jgi:hypothetical protein
VSQPLIIAPPTKYGNQFSFVKQPLGDSISNFFNPASVFMAGVLGSASGLHLSTRHSLDADRRGRTGCADLNDKKNCFPSDVDEPYDVSTTSGFCYLWMHMLLTTTLFCHSHVFLV